MSDQTGQTPRTDAALPPRVRLWLAPAIALGLALLFLAILFIPGVLRFPGQVPQADLAALEDTNAALEAEIARLGEAAQGGVCMHDGQLYPLEVEGDGLVPPDPAKRLDVLPPHPADLAPTGSALSGDAAFDGTMDDLLRRGTVLVLALSDNGFGWGSGFFVDPLHIATNAHVIEGADRIVVTNDSLRAPLAATVVARTRAAADAAPPQPDFALIRLDQPAAGALPLTFGDPARTQQVYASGYPGFFVADRIEAYLKALSQGAEAIPPEGVVTDGMVTTVQTGDSGEGGAPLVFLPHTADISPGNSGGPLVDRCGRVVGINTFVTQASVDELLLQGDYALSSANLAQFLAANGVTARQDTGPCDPAADTGAPE